MAVMSQPTAACPHGENCACAIMSRHDWFEAFCQERDRLHEVQASKLEASASGLRALLKAATDRAQLLEATVAAQHEQILELEAIRQAFQRIRAEDRERGEG